MRIACLTLGLLAGFGSIADAHASTCVELPPEHGAWLPSSTVDTVPHNGALVMRADVFGDVRDHLGDFVTVVVEHDGVPVPGSLAVVVRYEDAFTQEVSLVWTPDGGFTPGASYTVSLETDPELDTGGEQSAPFVEEMFTASTAPGSPTIASLSALQAMAWAEPHEPRVCCDDYESACVEDPEPWCVTTRLRNIGWVSGDLVDVEYPDLDHYGLAFHRAVRGVDGTATEPALWLSPTGQELIHTYPEVAESLCLGVQTVSYADGSVIGEHVECVEFSDYDPTQWWADEPEFLLSQCDGVVYWEDTGEPYEPAGGSSEGGGSESGDAGSSDGGEATDEGGSETTQADPGSDASGEGSGGAADAPPSESEASCACTHGRGTSASWLLMLLGLAARRPRITASTRRSSR